MQPLFLRRQVRGWLIPLALWWLTGCATPHIDWAGRIGVYTYDQAVLDLGPPDKQVKLQDGTTVAEWLIRRGYPQVYVPYGYGPPYGCAYPFYPAYATAYSPDYYLRLIFGPDNRLKGWKNLVK
jgi:hypothetical protein